MPGYISDIYIYIYIYIYRSIQMQGGEGGEGGRGGEGMGRGRGDVHLFPNEKTLSICNSPGQRPIGPAPDQLSSAVGLEAGMSSKHTAVRVSNHRVLN